VPLYTINPKSKNTYKVGIINPSILSFCLVRARDINLAILLPGQYCDAKVQQARKSVWAILGITVLRVPSSRLGYM
jgi:hypothetical protein